MPTRSRYVLHKKVARGGMAEIYLGKQVGDDGFQRVCCIKRILPHYAQDKEFIEMFRDEAHICKRLQHANIIRVEGFEEVEGSYAIIMEFVNGGDLRTVLSTCEKVNRNMSVPMAAYIIAESARGLHFAHSKIDDISGRPLEIVHRDISPQNILVSFEGEVKVTDFGIAEADNRETETKPGVVKGKYSYMSPEQISAKPVDARTDVFALAIVLWEALAMRRLFSGDNEVETIQMVRSCSIDIDIRQLNPQVDDMMYSILMKGLAKDPRDRFASAAELEKALRVYISTKHAGFTTVDLSDFVKSLLHERLMENQGYIKELLLEKAPEPSPAAKDDATQVFRQEGSVGSTKQNSGNQDNNQQFSPKLRDTSASQTVGKPSTGRTSANRVSSDMVTKSNQMNRQKKGSGMGSASIGQRSRNARAGQGYTGVHRTQTHSAIMSKVVVPMIIFVAFVVGGYFLFKQISQGRTLKDFYYISFNTTPQTVRIQADGKKLYKNKYISTPRKFKIKPGIHSFTFERTGFKSETIEVDVDRNIDKDIVLERIDRMAPVELLLKKDNEQKINSIFVILDDGEVSGSVDANNPFKARDITFGVNHSLWVFPNGRKSSKGRFNCKFIPRATSWLAPFQLEIDIDRRDCRSVFKN